MERKYISDIIKEKDIKSWNNGDMITINAPVGSGKSHFIKYQLNEMANQSRQKILMLVHRNDTYEQFINEIKDNNIKSIDLVKYQSVEARVKHLGSFDMNSYKYIVCDEFHYFLSDATMNRYTDMSLNTILNATNSIKILMSATGDHLNKFLREEKDIKTIDYNVPTDGERIANLHFFIKDETYHHLIDKFIKNREKSMLFIDNENVTKLYKEYKGYSTFNCSDNHKSVKYRDDNTISDMLKTEKFNSLLLFSTSVMDAGVNIKDKKIKNIVVDMLDVGKLIQCIGRRRFDKDDPEDKINVYIKNIPNSKLGGLHSKFKGMLVKPDTINWGSQERYIEQFGRQNDKNDLVYNEIDKDGKIRLVVNDLMYFKYQYDANEISKMLKVGYMRYIANTLKKDKYSIVEKEIKKNTLDEYLDGVIGKKLFKEEQKELISKIDVRVNGRQQTSYRKLNDGLEMIGMSYMILPKKSNSKRYWIVEKYDK